VDLLHIGVTRNYSGPSRSAARSKKIWAPRWRDFAAPSICAPAASGKARAAHQQHLCKIAFRRQLIARFQFARAQTVEKLFRDVAGDRSALDRQYFSARAPEDIPQSPSARVRIWSRLTASISTTPRVTSCQKLDTSINVRPLFSVPRMRTARSVPQTLPRPP